MKRSKLLYHASQNRNIKVLEPRAESVRDKDEGLVVFATPDKILASIFLVPTNDSWTKSGLFGVVHYFVCSDKNRFLKEDKGGAIYNLPSETFETDEMKGLGDREWTSKVPVKPVSIEMFESGLKAMLKLGVQVYFVTQQQFQDIKKSKDHGNSILRKSTSENQKLSLNVKEIPKVDL